MVHETRFSYDYPADDEERTRRRSPEWNESDLEADDFESSELDDSDLKRLADRRRRDPAADRGHPERDTAKSEKRHLAGADWLPSTPGRLPRTRRSNGDAD